MSTELTAPDRADLEAMSLADRVRLETVATGVAEIARQLNDAEIRRMKEAGASQRAVAAAMGVHHSVARRRLAALGLAAPVPGGADYLRGSVGPTHPVPQNGDVQEGEGEEVDGEIMDESEPDDTECCPTCGRRLPAHMRTPYVPRRKP